MSAPVQDVDMQVGDLITKGLESVSPDATLLDAAEKMFLQDVRALAVLQDNELVGIITDRDITVRAIAQGVAPHRTPVKELMSREIETMPAHCTLSEAGTVMEKLRLARIVVTDGRGMPFGIVSLEDFALYMRERRLLGAALKVSARPRLAL
jgi:CBS domain-containing protein